MVEIGDLIKPFFYGRGEESSGGIVTVLRVQGHMRFIKYFWMDLQEEMIPFFCCKSFI